MVCERIRTNYIWLRTSVITYVEHHMQLIYILRLAELRLQGDRAHQPTHLIGSACSGTVLARTRWQTVQRFTLVSLRCKSRTSRHCFGMGAPAFKTTVGRSTVGWFGSMELELADWPARIRSNVLPKVSLF